MGPCQSLFSYDTNYRFVICSLCRLYCIVCVITKGGLAEQNFSIQNVYTAFSLGPEGGAVRIKCALGLSVLFRSRSPGVSKIPGGPADKCAVSQNLGLRGYPPPSLSSTLGSSAAKMAH